MTRPAPSGPVRLTLVMDKAHIGGAEVLLLSLFRHLDPAVARANLLCLKEIGTLGPEFAAAGFPVEVVGGGRWGVGTVVRLARAFRRHRTEVVLVTHLHRRALTFARFTAWLTRRRSVVAPHGMDTLTFNGNRVLPRHDVETLFWSDALALVAPSQGAYLRRHEGVGASWRSRIREVVIPNGIALPPPTTPASRAAARTALGLADDDLVVGIVARLAPVKAHEVLLEAIAKLAPAHPRMKLVCIGGGERESELARLADELGVTDHVVFAGMRRDVAQLVPAFDVACLTSRFECAPLSVIESMAAGLPVVVSDVGAVRDMVVDGVEGLLFPPGDVSALAAQLGRLAEDAALRERMGSAGRAHAERDFRIEHTARKYQQLLCELAGRR
jgi:glycosyltransferase involved in cell wall biosynthesis